MGDEIVVSGISGRLPESDSIAEFQKNLYEGIDMVTEDSDRWPPGLFGIPNRSGKLKNLEYFDATFFGVSAKQTNQMDPLIRILQEVVYEAIIDAGVNPNDIRGSRTGVFIGHSNSDALNVLIENCEAIEGYSMTGCAKTMAANRISWAFDLRGPSYTVDSACSSSLYALQQAFSAIKNGECDAAVVGSVNINLIPASTIQFHKLGMLSPEGKCRVFDASGLGFARAEGNAAVFLQKSSDAKRIYTTILGARSNCDGYTEMGITFPSRKMQYQLLCETYERYNVDPAQVCYIEAHGTGTKVGDPEETNSITDFFCKNRKTPLLIGSVKSNMGHAEITAGLAGLIKVILSMESGMIPANLHFKIPNPNIPALIDGRLKVVDENLPWNGGIVGMNSYGFGGANTHVILRSNSKQKKQRTTTNRLPRLVCVSGRTEEAVKFFLDYLDQNKDDSELLGLVDEIHSKNINGHPYRGYAILGDEITEICEQFENNRPIWFVYSGMGSQWKGMGKDLMKIEVYRKSIEKSKMLLEPHGIDLEDLLINGDEKTFDNILNSFICIASVQVALTDVLKSIGIVPDGVVGHSVGEVICAYADGGFTAEQAVLAAYYRGRAIVDTDLKPGAMASVGLSWEECQNRNVPDILLACNNSADNVTVSGPPEAIQKFVTQLQSEGVFAKAVRVGNFAFHSKHIEDAGPNLKKALEAIIPNPRPRSKKWVSSSVPETKWDSPVAQLCSADYHVNNLLSPVLFYNVLHHIPKNAIVIEVAPHGLLQSILKRSLDPNVLNVSIVKKGHSDNTKFLLSNIGKIYAGGAQPKIAKLYDPVVFPVSKGTPMLNSAIKWDHSIKWNVPGFSTKELSISEFNIDLGKEEFQFLAGHTIDGRILFPATGYLFLAWQAFAKLVNVSYDKLPVIIENVRFLRASIMSKKNNVSFLVRILKGSGDFEISENDTLVVTGRIYTPEDITKETICFPTLKTSAEVDVLPLDNYDVYKELRLRGYHYSGFFCGLTEADNFGVSGKLKWDNNWVSFMDTMLHLQILSNTHRSLYLPTRLLKAVINPKLQTKIVDELENDKVIPVYYDKNIRVVKSGGVELRGMEASSAPRRQHVQPKPKLEKYQFVPYQNGNFLSQEDAEVKLHALTTLLQIIIENATLNLKVNEILNNRPIESTLAVTITEILEQEPMATVDYTVTSAKVVDISTLEPKGIKSAVQNPTNLEPTCENNVVILFEALKDKNITLLEKSAASLKVGGFILLEETTNDVDVSVITNTNLRFISTQVTKTKTYVLLRKLSEIPIDGTIIEVTDKNFAWVEPLKEALINHEKSGRCIYLVVQGEKTAGLLGMINCIRREPGGTNIRAFFLENTETEKFSLTSPKYTEQIKKDLMHNVLRKDTWGSYRHLRLDKKILEKPVPVKHAFVNTLIRGDLSSLKWLEGPLKYNKEEDLCLVYYASLNFRDIMLATGKLSVDSLPRSVVSKESLLGLEYSGLDSTGKRIMGMVETSALATTVIADNEFTWEVPQKWTLQEAATIPVVYMTSYYALVVHANIQPGESILIHAGTGGVGFSAISIALHMGCEVYTTCSTQVKRDFLKKTFPQLNDKNIGNSRDTTFEQLVLTQTNGRGVDVVLNSLAGEQLQASIRCLATGGRFLEIGKVDIYNNSPMGMSIFGKNVGFHGIHLDLTYSTNPKHKTILKRLLQEGIENGAVKPLPSTVFEEDQLEEAFRYLASGKHMGKVSIKIRDEKNCFNQTVIPKTVLATPRIYMNSKKSYIIVGGLGGFGLELTDWLIQKGATKIILTSRKGITNGYQSFCVRRWRDAGVTVIVSKADVTVETDTRRLLMEAKKLGVIGGIFNLAVVLNDAMMINQTDVKFETVCKAKVSGTKNLDIVSRVLAPQLDHFVTFSSVSCGRGNAGQSNYGYANSVMERICEERQNEGLPGIAIQWGAVGDVGLVAEKMGLSNNAEIGGTLPQNISSCLNALAFFLRHPHPVVSSMVLVEKRLNEVDNNKSSIVDAVAHVLGIKNTKTIPKNTTLSEMGMDSLMSSEIKQVFERNFDLILNPQEIRSLTFARLEELSVKKTESTNTNVEDDKISNDETVVTKFIRKETLINMPSRGSSSNKNPIFLLYPIEGVLDILETLASQIEAPIFGIQCTEEDPVDSIETLSKFYITQIRNIQPKGPYTLIGYSFGAGVAFEMGLQLEAVNEQVKLILLDGSPAFITKILDTLAENRDVVEDMNTLQALILANFIKQFKEVDEKETALKLVNLTSLEEKLKKTAQIISGSTIIENNSIAMAASLFYHRIQMARKYKPLTKFGGEVQLIKSTDNCIISENDYELNSVCKRSVIINTVKGDHKSILSGNSAKKIADIINNVV